MTAPGALHRQTFPVHSFETDAEARLAPVALCAFLQDAAGRHAQLLGVGMTQLIEQGLAWMLHRLCVEVEEWPAEHEEVVVETWPTAFTGAAAERAFRVKDSAGRPIVRAASRWAVVDLRARRAVRLTETIRRLPLGEAPVLALGPVPELPQGAPAVGEAQLRVGRADLDRLGHANNTRYLEWALEAVPDAWASGHELAAFDVVFRREARHADPVRSRAVQLDPLRLGHELALPGERAVLATLETRWRPGRSRGGGS